MSRRHRSAPLAGLALCSLLIAGCGTGGPPSRGSARDEILDAYIARGFDSAAAAEIADCIATGLYDSGDFTEDERNDVIQATDGDDPDPDLVAKAQDLLDGCEDDAGSESQTGTDSTDSTDETTTTTNG